MDKPTALADEAVHLKLTGLKAHQRVTLGAATVDSGNGRWTSHADFTADDAGTVDLAAAAPAAGGSYTGADPMGLVRSITPAPGNAAHSYFPSAWPAPFTVDITATADGKQIAETTLTRDWKSSGVTDRPLTLAADKVFGDLYLPPADSARHPAVLLLGGSEGGESMRSTAQLLASHGFPALNIAYWKEPGLPSELKDVPLEYIAAAGRLLAAEPGVDPAHVLALGYSRGSEAALQVAQYFPDVFHGAVLYAPNMDAYPSFPDGHGNAWTLGGKAVPIGPIPVDHVSGPVYAFAGAQDHVWGSASSADSIVFALEVAHDPFPHEKWVYPASGHGVGTYPYLPDATAGKNPDTGKVLDFGGTTDGDQAARRDGWTRVLALLGSLKS